MLWLEQVLIHFYRQFIKIAIKIQIQGIITFIPSDIWAGLDLEISSTEADRFNRVSQRP